MGRFTQEDPIGLAGGLNLYGFAGGDPVNHSDPFGLCPPQDTNDGPECKKVVALGVTASWVIGKGPSMSAGVILSSGEGPGVFLSKGVHEGIAGGVSADLTVAESMNQFGGATATVCVGAGPGSVCGGKNSSGNSVGASVTLRGPIPATATVGTTVTQKVTWKDVKEAAMEWAKPGLAVITGAPR